MKHNSDIRFSVEYWLNKSQYRDDYIQNLLEFELKSIMLNNIKSLGIENSDIFIGPIQGPPFEVSERLYEYYCNLGYYPKLEHINGKEIFSYSKIYIKEKLSENEKKNYKIYCLVWICRL